MTELVFTRDLADIAEADREGVASLRAKYGHGPKKKHGFLMGLFGGSKGDDKDIIACDDMTINTGRSSLIDLAVLAVIAFLAAKYFGLLPTASGAATASATATAPATPAPVASGAADLIFYVDNGDGTVSQTKIEPLPPALADKIVPPK